MFGCYGGRGKRAAAGGRDYKHGLMGNGKLGEKWKRDVLAGGVRLAPRVHAQGRIGVNRDVCDTHFKVVCSLEGGGTGIYTLKLKNKNTSLCFSGPKWDEIGQNAPAPAQLPVLKLQAEQ